MCFWILYFIEAEVSAKAGVVRSSEAIDFPEDFSDGSDDLYEPCIKSSNSSNDKYNDHSKLPMGCDESENNAEIKDNTSTSRESQKQKFSISLVDYELTSLDDGEKSEISVSDSAKKLVRWKRPNREKYK